MIKSPRLEDDMKIIGIDQSLCNRSYFEHKCLNNIKNVYQHAVKCDNQHNLEDILNACMVSTPEKGTDDSHNVPMTSAPVKKKVLVNHCVFSRTYLMLKRKQQNFVLELNIQTQSHEIG